MTRETLTADPIDAPKHEGCPFCVNGTRGLFVDYKPDYYTEAAVVCCCGARGPAAPIVGGSSTAYALSEAWANWDRRNPKHDL